MSKTYASMLKCHPNTRSDTVGGIEVLVGWMESGALALTYSLKGDIARLRIPPSRLPRRADRLWQHTCFEVFIAEKGQPAYYEFNFSPSSEWAVYAFRSYRDGGPVEDEGLDPKIAVRKEIKTLELNAVIRLNHLPMIQYGASLRLGLSAVIEESDEHLSYWALRHPPGKPDFHHPFGFVLEIDPPDKETLSESAMDKS